jgi:hypothetical protein
MLWEVMWRFAAEHPCSASVRQETLGSAACVLSSVCLPGFNSSNNTPAYSVVFAYAYTQGSCTCCSPGGVLLALPEGGGGAVQVGGQHDSGVSHHNYTHSAQQLHHLPGQSQLVMSATPDGTCWLRLMQCSARATLSTTRAHVQQGLHSVWHGCKQASYEAPNHAA